VAKEHSTLVIGVGNPLRRDDGAGLAVAGWLKQRLPDTIVVLQHDGDGADLMEAWRGAAMVVLVDAACAGALPGTVYRFDAEETELPRGIFHYSSHLFGVAEAVEMARALNRLPERIIVYGIEGASFAHGEKLSPEVANAVAEVAHRIFTELTMTLPAKPLAS